MGRAVVLALKKSVVVATVVDIATFVLLTASAAFGGMDIMANVKYMGKQSKGDAK